MRNKDHAVTLGEWANIAIAKHSRKMFKYKVKVIKDKDPENLHQMRVGMRRLRSAISGFAIAVDLPKTINEKTIAKISRSLGKLRDLDVLLATLVDNYRPLLPSEEQKSLDKAIESLHKQRKQEFKQVRRTLDSKPYFHLQQELHNWLEQPKYKVIGDCSIYLVLPDLLLPQISRLLLHPGWLVGVKFQLGTIQLREMLSKQAIEQILEKDELMLHNLRKQAKKTRYNLELFAQFYDDTYHYYVKQIEQIQEVLGQIQDCYVLRVVLEKVLNSAIAEQLPKLATLLTETRYQKWQEWSILQEEFLDNKTRKELRQTIQHPRILNNQGEFAQNRIDIC